MTLIESVNSTTTNFHVNEHVWWHSTTRWGATSTIMGRSVSCMKQCYILQCLLLHELISSHSSAVSTSMTFHSVEKVISTARIAGLLTLKMKLIDQKSHSKISHALSSKENMDRSVISAVKQGTTQVIVLRYMLNYLGLKTMTRTSGCQLKLQAKNLQ